jgi:Flp pilus assembly protein TadD
MQRARAVVAAVATAAALAFYVSWGRETPDAASAPIERLIGSGRTVDARRELASKRAGLDAATADYLEGLIDFAEGKNKEALDALARARLVRPGDWRIVNTSAAAMAGGGKFDEAVALIDAYVASAPKDERGLAAVAQYALEEGHGKPDPVKALAALDRIAALPSWVGQPGDPTAISPALVTRLRTKAYILGGKQMDAMLEARRAAEATPTDPEAWFLLGEAARRLKKGPESTDAYRKALQLAPGSRRYAEQLVLALIQFQGDGAEILGIAERLAAAYPDDPSLKVLRARALVRADRIDDAETIYRALRKEDGLPPRVRLDALRNLGVLLYDWKAGSREGAYLDEACELLREYVRLGGEVDDDLRPTWEELEARDKKKKENKPK